ncbi:hypothetical protein [Kouleothrix sp.]|uniref:hypothetical protein n=1 Tax=Kouleothrix sp. TaxID=2779161 RepID=UPI003918AC46
MTTPTTMFDGLLDDDAPTTLTAREQADAQQERDDAPSAPLAELARSAIAPADPDDGDIPTDEPAHAPALDNTAGATEKLVIVEGQTFVVDATIDNETIREHLIRQGFANLAGAEIRTGARQHQGQTVPTVDFIKRAGTKG